MDDRRRVFYGWCVVFASALGLLFLGPVPILIFSGAHWRERAEYPGISRTARRRGFPPQPGFSSAGRFQHHRSLSSLKKFVINVSAAVLKVAILEDQEQIAKVTVS